MSLSVQTSFFRTVESPCRELPASFLSCLQTIYLGLFAFGNNFFCRIFHPPSKKVIVRPSAILLTFLNSKFNKGLCSTD